MKRIVLMIVVCVLVSGCGGMEKVYDNANYESLTNETGKVEIISGGKVVRTYESAEILYSSADTQALFINVGGNTIYVQGDAIITLQ